MRATSPSGSASGSNTPWSNLPGPGPLLEPEYKAPYGAYTASPGPRTAGPLLDALHPVIDEALRSYAGTEAQTATLRARAKQMTLEGVRRYDPQRAKLRTHLLSHLRGLRRVSERTTAGVYVPEQWRLDARKVDNAYGELRDELGREPSEAELSDRVGLPPVRVRKARSVPGVLAGGQVGDVGLSVSSPSERAWKQWVEAVYHDLSPVDQVILERRLGLHGVAPLPANRVAKMLNLSAGSISQRAARIQQMLDEFDSLLGRR